MGNLRAVTVLALIAITTIIGCIPLYLLGVVRFVLPHRARGAVTHALHGIVQWWAGCHQRIFELCGVTRIETRWENADDLSTDRWYLVVSNHQSWADILVLQNVLHGRIPILKFFTKRQLIWVPFIGVAMWFLRFPYVRRLSRERIAADPSLMALDREAALDACQGFRDHPTAALAFLEGTRLTAVKHAAQDEARFGHLLNPKLGGVSYVVTALNDKLHKVLDVTLSYPDGVPTFWQFLQGRARKVEVLIQGRTLPADAYAARDPETVREALRPWIEALWREKDERLRPCPPLAN